MKEAGKEYYRQCVDDIFSLVRLAKLTQEISNDDLKHIILDFAEATSDLLKMLKPQEEPPLDPIRKLIWEDDHRG